MSTKFLKIAATIVCPLAAVLCANAATAGAQHAYHGVAVTTDGLGTVAFENSCASNVQRDFQVGIAALHSFSAWDGAFVAIAKRDPTCAIALWAAAMTVRGNPLAGSLGAEALKAGRGYIENASRIRTTEREQALIDALAVYYGDFEGQAARTTAYEAAMEKVHFRYPDDTEIAAFYALAILEAVDLTDKTYARQIKAGTILEPLWTQHPGHPGAPHYIIHAYDYGPLAARALPAARAYASIAPASAHAQHMPAHIFTVLGLWDESIKANRNSIAISNPKVAPDSAEADVSDTHAFDFIAYARLQLAQDRRVNADLSALRKKGNRQIIAEARYALERGDWNAARALEFKSESAFDRAIARFTRALGAARLRDVKMATSEGQSVKALREPVRREVGDYWAGFVDIFTTAADAWIARAEGRHAEAITLMRKAADLDDAREKHILLENKLLPMREVLGDMLLDLGKPAEALDAYRASLDRAPNRYRSLAGAARAAKALGRDDLAREWYGKLAALAAEADAQRPEIAEAHGFVKR